jgi:hypothetical protein
MVDESRQRAGLASQLAIAVGLFVPAWVGCWIAKSRLLAWLCSPLATAPDGARPTLQFSRPAELFVAYLTLCTVGALIAVLPLLTRAVVFRRRAAPASFLRLSYGVLALVLVVVQVGLVPALVRSFEPAQGPIVIRVGDFVSVLSSVHLVELAGAQLAVVLLFATSLRRSRGEGWPWPLLRWLLLSVGASVVAAVVTPPEVQSYVWLPLSFLLGLATLVGRLFGGSSLSGLDERSGPSEDTNPYRPPFEQERWP